jgi:uncharacterized protein
MPARLLVKAVPGARRDEIAGWLGDRLKVRIAAPPEAGRANQAICTLLATHLGLNARDVTIVAGHASPAKTLQIEGLSQGDVARLLGPPPPG